jgi:hypothetical protein
VEGARDRALAALGAAAGLVTAPAACAALDAWGPSSRVDIAEYLPSSFVPIVVFAGIVGASLGAELYGWLTPHPRAYRVGRLTWGAILGASLLLVACGLGLLLALAAVPALRRLELPGPALGALLLAIASVGAFCGAFALFAPAVEASRPSRAPWVRIAALVLVFAHFVVPQFTSFPANGTMTERDAWARANLREYPKLVQTVSIFPLVVADVGRVLRVAPTSEDRHFIGRDMNGDYMNVTLELVGEKGTGRLRVSALVMDGWFREWREGSWTAAGRVTALPTAPPGTMWPQR